MSTENKNNDNETPVFSPDAASEALRSAFLELSRSAWDIEKEISSQGSSADLFESAHTEKKSGSSTEIKSSLNFDATFDLKKEEPVEKVSEEIVVEEESKKNKKLRKKRGFKKNFDKQEDESVGQTPEDSSPVEIDVTESADQNPVEIEETESVEENIPVENPGESEEKSSADKIKKLKGFFKGFNKKSDSDKSKVEDAFSETESDNEENPFEETVYEETVEVEETSKKIDIVEENPDFVVQDGESEEKVSGRKIGRPFGFLKRLAKNRQEVVAENSPEEISTEENYIEENEEPFESEKEVSQNMDIVEDDSDYADQEEKSEYAYETETDESYEDVEEFVDETESQEYVQENVEEESVEIDSKSTVKVKEKKIKEGPSYFERMFAEDGKSNKETTGLWRTIMLRELQSYFTGPVAYIVTALFLGISGFLFFSTFFLADRAELRGFFANLPMLFSFFIPALTMRLFSEEKKSGSLETLVTLPVTTLDIVIGKYLASLISALTLLLPTLFYVIGCHMFGQPDAGPIWGGYLGAVFLAAAYSAIGLFSSCVTKNQILAFFVAFAICFFLALVSSFVFLLPSFLANLFSFISAVSHFDSISRGILDSRDLIYFISVTVFFVALTVRCLNKSRKG